MKRKAPLPLADEAPKSLGLSTIMSADLASLHGVDYVHIAALAIDLDRIREGIEIDPEAREWPFAWDVYLTELFLLERVNPQVDAHRRLVEDLCWSIFEFGPGDPRLGGQILFAIYGAVDSGVWPAEWMRLFDGWPGKPTDLMKELKHLRSQGSALRVELAQNLLTVPVDPPVAPPSLKVFKAWAKPPV